MRSARSEVTRDRGSATVWVLAFVALLWFATGAVVVVVEARVCRHRAGVVADFSALAAADSAFLGERTACAAAASIAREGGGRLVICSVRGRVVDVTVEVAVPRVLGSLPGTGGVRARARAGPTRGSVVTGARAGR